jgi:hypothetical protein
VLGRLSMGNQHSNERPKTGRGGGLLTSAEEIEEWLPDSVKRLEKGSLPAHRDVDWTDETVVEKATQVPAAVERRARRAQAGKTGGRCPALVLVASARLEPTRPRHVQGVSCAPSGDVRHGRAAGWLRAARVCARTCPARAQQPRTLREPRASNCFDRADGTRTKQLNTIHNVVEERKTLKRTNSFSGKLANLSIGKKRGERKKTGLARSVSFSSLEREELTFDAGCSCEAFSPEEHGYHAAMQLVKDNGGQFQFSPTSVCVDDHSHRPY